MKLLDVLAANQPLVCALDIQQTDNTFVKWIANCDSETVLPNGQRTGAEFCLRQVTLALAWMFQIVGSVPDALRLRNNRIPEVLALSSA